MMADDKPRSSSPWSFLQPPEQPDEIGRLAQYRILKPLGQGGMGLVFLAEDSQLRRLAAVKVMRPECAALEESRARFLREARAIAALKHERIVTIYQVGEDQDVPFLAMEFLKGRSLDEWLRPDRRASIPEALTIASQIAEGLAAAHAAGLIHRDIKPANIWLETPPGRVKLLDFGLARQVAGEFTELTHSGVLMGTPAYMSPEQVRGDTRSSRHPLWPATTRLGLPPACPMIREEFPGWPSSGSRLPTTNRQATCVWSSWTYRLS